MRSSLRRHLSALTLLSSLFAALTFAQSDTASISGFVKDPSGSAVPNATVTVLNEATQIERKAVTNDSGYYVVTSLPPGFYTVVVEATGFQKFRKTQNKLDPNIATTVPIDLSVGNMTQTVDVVATASAVQSESSTVGKLVSKEQIASLQLNGRNPIYLAQLQPGVRRGSSISNFNFGLDSGGFNINGSRSEENLITFDGAPAVRTRANGTSIGVADADSTQEVQILTANYNAEYGRSSGGQIRIVTKSGTRDLHVDLYEYFRNSALDANSWVRNASGTALANNPAPFRFNQFGFSVSGPIVLPKMSYNRDRNKLFWMFGQEYIRYRQDSTSTQVVPSMAMRQGDFSELLSPTNIFYGKTKIVTDPTTGLPFANNIIPASRLSASGIGLLSAYPAPNFSQGGNNWISDASAPQNQRKDTGSLDYLPAQNHYIRFRVQNYDYYSYSPFYGNFNRTPQTLSRPNQTFSANYIWTISPTMVNEFLASASVDHVRIGIDTSSGLYDRTSYGINYPYIYNTGKELNNKIPTIQISQGGIQTLDGGPYPSHSGGPVYTLSDNVTKIAGNHSYKFGFSWERAGENDFDQINVSSTIAGSTNNQNGRFVFSDSRTGAATSGVAVANAALGLFDTYGEIGQRSYTIYRGNMFEYFLQDSWKVDSKLRVEYGIRHSIIQPYYATWGNMSVFDTRVYNPALAVSVNPKTGYVTGSNIYNGLVIPGNGFPDSATGRVAGAGSAQLNGLIYGFPKSYNPIDWRDFQPRVGIAYSLNPKTVFRAGAGRFITRPGISDSIFLGGNPPFQPTATVTNGSVDNPGGTSTNQYPLAVTTYAFNNRNPESWTWNATFERELPGAMTISIGYVGRRGLHLPRESNLNQLQPGTLQANAGVNTDALRPYLGYAVIRQSANDNTSRYNGLQINLTRRLSKGLLFGVAYTLSKSTDGGSSYRDVLPNTYDASTFYGPSTFDTRHMLVTNWVYDLPSFKDANSLVRQVAGGWELTGTMQAQTGTPLTVSTGTDYAGVGAGSGNQIWNINGNPSTLGQFATSTSQAAYWFAVTNADGSSIFTAPAAGTFTTQKNRDKIYGPGFQSWNAGLQKAIRLGEKQSVRFKFEAFNFINHPNWDNPTTDPTSAKFGKILTKNSQRNLQVSLRYSF